MKTITALAFLLPLVSAASLTAQIQIPVNPKATYLRTNNDASAVPAPGIPLSALGVAAGQWLRITTVGNYSDGGAGDTQRGLVCLFSANPTLLPNSAGLLERVPGAILAGPAVATPNTYYGNQSTDVPQDFVVSRNSWNNGVLVKVPTGANYLFLAVNDPNYSFYGNNVDPNSDFQAVFTVETPPLLHGTEEHCELWTAVNGTPTPSPDVKQASPFSTLSVEIHQSFGLSNNQIYILAANVFNTGGSAPVGPLPDFHIGGDALLVQFGVTAATPGLWSLFVPPGHAGTTLILQAFHLNSAARNGVLEASDAHRIELQ